MISVEGFQKANKAKPVKTSFKIGTIPGDYVTGRPTIQFDGEGTVSTRTYPYADSYTPAVGDRVLVAVVGDGAVIICKII